MTKPQDRSVVSRRGLFASALCTSALIGTAMSGTHADTGIKLDPENTVYLDLKDGRVVIQLRPELAPKTVAQFKTLVRQGFYDGTPFHRVIDGFMAQGGDPTGTGTGGSKLPNVPAEFSKYAHFLTGTVGMARSQDPNSGNSQFYIMFAPAPHLDGQYTIWGQVTQGMEFVDKIKGGSIPREFIKPVKEGIEIGLQNGVKAGYPVSDLIVTLVDGSYHDVDSDEISFQLAAKYAIKDALNKAGSVFMEPIMKLEVEVSDDHWGNVTGDLMKRRAQIKETGNRGKLKTALIDVPLSEMFGYANALRSLTQGRASFSMEPSFYAQVPNAIAEKIIGARQEFVAKVS